MRIFVISLLGIIFVTMITSSIPHIIADELDVVTTENSKYEIYLHVLVRNAQGELISIAETLPCESGDYCSEYMVLKYCYE